MEFSIDNICKLTKRIGNKQLMAYTQIIRKNMLDAGVARETTETILKQAIKEFRKKQTFEASCNNALQGMSCSAGNKENRGIDSIGRLLVEYCFIRSPEGRLLWPEDSEQDLKARENFTSNILPRPLMRYFLISVRGAISEINKYEAVPALFGEENQTNEERKEYVKSLIKEMAGTDSTPTQLDWNKIYADPRFQKVALEFIGDIRRKIAQFGHERYLRILDNLHQRDPENKGLNAMHRSFTIEDVKQIDDSLWAAEEALSASLR